MSLENICKAREKMTYITPKGDRNTRGIEAPYRISFIWSDTLKIWKFRS